MKIAISATNPSHLYDLAKAWHELGALGAFHSGYPGWRLHPPSGFPLRAHSWRTVATYAALRLPDSLRPTNATLFRWQDAGFDRAVAAALHRDDGELIHAMPGQALRTFQTARRMGIETCLNHASGPLRRQLTILAEEHARSGLPPPPVDADQLEQRAAETMLADWHCVASTIVRDQLLAEGVAADRVWISPYGADPAIFHPPQPPRNPGCRLVFAGQITPRKGLRVLFAALRRLDAMTGLALDCYGPVGADAANEIRLAGRDDRIRLHAPVSQIVLADHFRQSDLLILPSWEEAFGLVVAQALNCGLPVIVSDRVGARDLIRHRENGSVVPVGDDEALAAEIVWWLNNPGVFRDSPHTWREPAGALLDQIQNRHARPAA